MAAINSVTGVTFTNVTTTSGITITGNTTATSSSSGNAVSFWAVSGSTEIYLGTLTGISNQTKSYTFNSTVTVPAGSYTIQAFASSSTTYPGGTSIGLDPIQNLCFMAGTMIGTPDGEAAIETLNLGDLVLTSDGVAKPVNWLGKQTVSTVFADPIRRLPIRVRAGALAENVPSRDLLVSPDHALLVDGVLVHASALVNGTSIIREANVPEIFVYYHVELDDHSLILAENTPAETFVDNVDRRNFDNWAEFETLYPDGKAVEELPYPRAKAHRQVPAHIRVALADRAQAIGAAGSAVA